MSIELERTCPFCGKQFELIIHEQIPGFRDTEELCCPYCGRVIRQSMEYEFYTFKKGKEENNVDK